MEINPENCAGRNPREVAAKRRKARKELGLCALVLVVSASLIFICYLKLGHPKVILSLGVFGIFVLLLCKLNRIFIPAMDKLYLWEGLAAKGARAEEKIGALLDQLPNCIVWHDVNTGCGNIDHVAFRKDGAVFLIETKSHYGKIINQNGELRRSGKSFEKDFISQTHRNVFWLKDFLKARLGFEPWIHAVIVFSNGHVEKHLKIKGVAVVNVSFLSEWIRRQPGNLKIAALWPEIKNLKDEFSASIPIHLAPPFILR